MARFELFGGLIMVETVTGTNRSKGLAYQGILKTDGRRVPDHLKLDSPLSIGPLSVEVS
jgi:hypothetical protein